MKFWKEHGTLRIAAITACFVLGLSLVLGGWVQTGKLPGLVTMMVGLVFLLAAIMIYNKPFEDPK
jgi:formate/nitrite transporter FocA (FNT family)